VSVVLAVDGGQSGTRLRLVVDDTTVREWRAAAGLGHWEPHVALAGLVDEIAATLERDGSPAPEVLCAGMTGFHGAVTGAERVLSSYRPLGVRRVVLATDAVTSYLGAVGVVPGVVVAAGTGTIVLASDGRGRCARIDGWGSTLGDDGSGYAIGRAGLRAAYRSLDGRGGSEALRTAAEERFGSLDELPRRIAAAQDAVKLVAGFAESVAQVAAAGDPTATAIWSRAGADLADSAAAAAVRVFGRPDAEGAEGVEGVVDAARAPAVSWPASCAVSWAGALFAAGGLLVDPFQDGLAKHGLPPARPPAGNGLTGAVQLAGEGVAALFPEAAEAAGRDL
jgi:N-acetylglucosamine kinase-like BadF-type ATPase